MNAAHRSSSSRFHNDETAPLTAFLDEMLRPLGVASAWGTAATAPTTAVDINETADAYVLQCDLPGVLPADIALSFEDNVVTLKASRSRPEPGPDEGALRSERAFGSLERSFRLPKLVDATKVHSKFDRGVLTVVLPKHEAAKPRTIEIKVEER